MWRSLYIIVVSTVLATASPGIVQAQSSTAEARLREALRTTAGQVRALENERASLQTKQTQSEREIAVLRAQVEALTGRLAREGSGAQHEMAAYKNRLSAQEAALGELQENAHQWKSAHAQAAEQARLYQAESTKIAEERAAMTERVTQCEAKNAELFKVGGEILERYANVGLLDVVRAREPFVGLKSVELQNIAQSYEDKLLDGKVN